MVRPYHGFAASNANVLTDNLHLLQNSGCEEINNFIQDLLFVDEDKGETVISLRKLVFQIAPSAKEEIKSVEFDTGSGMQDPNNFLEGSGKNRQHLKIFSVTAIEMN